MIIEVCATNISIANEAAEIGADRLELCQCLEVGGLTPSYAFIEKACQLPIPIRVLIRPRAGNFSYSLNELEMMIRDIEICKELGVEAVVIGALTEDHRLDVRSNQILLDSQEDMKFIFHRGIDLLGTDGLRSIHAFGYNGALCSGHVHGVSLGLENLEAYRQLGLENFELVAGGGVSTSNISDIKALQMDAVHFSCQKEKGNKANTYDFKVEFDNHKWNAFQSMFK